MVRISIVDNYDSFAHNLEQYVGEFAEVDVERYEEPPDADGVVFSPGPGKPDEFPVMRRTLSDTDVPVLGVCLGHQAIAEFYGGKVGYADEVVHGKTSEVVHDSEEVGRYHSLVVDDVVEPLEVTATAEGADEIMAVRHTEKPVYGVQFHPESVLTPEGKEVVRNFVRIVEDEKQKRERGKSRSTQHEGER
ncbi:MAG: aminodeoxychorismate/anthranilate synthase component II [Halobacteria archaeon]|nr:aminodeoxychorismate/anthranilate synthase component II [Halobacteria archaeon]